MSEQLSLFGGDKVVDETKRKHCPKPKTYSPPVHSFTRGQQITEDDQLPPAQLEAERLRMLNLRYGMTYVYYHNGQIVGFGDTIHCPREDIEHNLSALAGYLTLTSVKTGGLGKAYDDDVYTLGKVNVNALPEAELWGELDFNIGRLEEQRRMLYKEPLYILTETERGFQPRLTEEVNAVEE